MLYFKNISIALAMIFLSVILCLFLPAFAQNSESEFVEQSDYNEVSIVCASIGALHSFSQENPSYVAIYQEVIDEGASDKNPLTNKPWQKIYVTNSADSEESAYSKIKFSTDVSAAEANTINTTKYWWDVITKREEERLYGYYSGIPLNASDADWATALGDEFPIVAAPTDVGIATVVFNPNKEFNSRLGSSAEMQPIVGAAMAAHAQDNGTFECDESRFKGVLNPEEFIAWKRFVETGGKKDVKLISSEDIGLKKLWAISDSFSAFENATNFIISGKAKKLQ